MSITLPLEAVRAVVYARDGEQLRAALSALREAFDAAIPLESDETTDSWYDLDPEEMPRF